MYCKFIEEKIKNKNSIFAITINKNYFFNKFSFVQKFRFRK